MKGNNHPSFLSMEMVPIGLESKEQIEMETILGKKNRIEIGYPRIIIEKTPSRTNLILKKHLDEFSIDKHLFCRLNLSLTLLPDLGCKFKTADFIIDVRESASGSPLPLFLRLNPSKKTTKKVVVVEKKERGVELSDPFFKILKADLKGDVVKKDQVEQMMVEMESFGLRTQRAGWRFRISDSREIPLTSSDLEVLVVMKKDTRSTAQFTVTAEIDIKSKIDRWLTWAFVRNEESALKASYIFPPE